MEAQLIDLARAAGTAVVTLMATDAWERTRMALARCGEGQPFPGRRR